MLRQLRNNEAHNLNFIRLYLWFNLCRQFLVLCSEVLLMFCSSSATLCLSAYNQFHNILRLFDVLSNFPFTTNETMGNYY